MSGTPSALTFSTFKVTPDNLYAHTAAWCVAEAEPGTNYNPLVLRGPSGSGKSHLLKAIAKVADSADDVTVYLAPANELITAARLNPSCLVDVDVLLVEDLNESDDFTASREMLTVLIRHGASVVITTDISCEAHKTMKPWVDAFEWGYMPDCGLVSPDMPGWSSPHQSKIALGRDFLHQVGLAELRSAEANHLLKLTYERLEVQVGHRILATGASRLQRQGIVENGDDTKSDITYEKLIDACPLLHLIVWEEFMRTKKLLAGQASAILAIETVFRESGKSRTTGAIMGKDTPFVDGQ